MNRLTLFFGNLNLRWKFTVINLLVLLIPLILIGTLFYHYAYQVIQTNDIDYKSSTVQIMAERINDYVRQVDRLTYSMYKKDEQAMLTSPPPFNSLYDSSYNDRLFASFLDSSNFTVVEGSIENTLFIRTDGTIHQSGNYLVDVEYAFAKTDWYRHALASNGETFVLFPNSRPYSIVPEGYSISFIRKINDLRTNTALGVLLIDIPTKSINELLKAFHLKEDTNIYLIDEAGKIIYSNQDVNKIGKNLDSSYYQWIDSHANGAQIKYVKNERMIASSTLSKVSWKIVSIDRMSDLSIALDQLRYRAYLLVLLSLVIGILLANYFTSRISNAISFLQMRMRRFQEGDFTATVNWVRKDEIGQLANSYNEMIARTTDLIRKNYIIRLKERDAQFKALQAQINPHFLYNTLDLISNIALIKQVPIIVEISRKFAHIFRYSISKKGPIVTLQEELEHVKGYLSILNIRYEKKFIIDFDIAPDTLSLPVIKSTLQPIVENAIYHGLEMKIGVGRLRISSSIQGGNHVIEIEDDGLGIAPDRLIEIRTQLDAITSPFYESENMIQIGESIGLLNIQERIRLHFGDPFGISLSSDPTGTFVTITLPSSVDSKSTS